MKISNLTSNWCNSLFSFYFTKYQNIFLIANYITSKLANAITIINFTVKRLAKNAIDVNQHQ